MLVYAFGNIYGHVLFLFRIFINCIITLPLEINERKTVAKSDPNICAHALPQDIIQFSIL